ncbi:NACHT domain-containing protein [Phormidium tenue FACHB-886]|nr:NACHT domain-containing protein [Phormidium tenue FACHB-886]
MPKLLILSSNPRRDLNLDREISDLSTAVQRLGKFEIGLGLGVRAQELPLLLAEHSPQVVHFCGHGAGEQGLVFQDENGREQLLSTEILTRIFKTFADEISCTVLNACDSDRQAAAIVEHVDYVVGMSQPILDKAAHLFSVGFYGGLACGKSIEQAYELGCIAIQIWSETQSQSSPTRQYRKLVQVGEVEQPARAQIAEYQKPVLLRKRTQLPASLAGSDSVPKVPLATPPDRPSEFVEFVQQEIDRQEYKDQARAAYDNFGQFSTANAPELKKSEYAQRKILVSKVKEFWIEGFLQPSLQGETTLCLDLKARPDAIANLSQGIEALSVKLDDSFEELRETQIYQELGQGRTLLILGDPGAGKTIALLQLAKRLLERSEQNLTLPMPVVFNLSSWAKERKTIVDWLLDELREKYQVPKVLSEPWLTQQQLILLLDGLDEVNADYSNDCVRALNEFMGLFPKTEVAVCSRVRDYEALSERLQISSALCLQPLSPQQVYEFLDRVGGALAGLRALLKQDAELEQFAQTPLILNFMSAAYQGWSVEKLRDELRSPLDRNQHLFETYIDRRLERGAASEYSKHQVLHWLSWLAGRMVQEKQTVFLIEKMQPTWLNNRSEARAYRIRTFIISGLSVGLIYGLYFGLYFGLSAGLIYGLYFGLVYGLFFGLSAGLSVRLSVGLIFGLGSGLGRSEIVQRAVPNQGIRTSRRNGIFIGLGGVLIGGLIGAPIGPRIGVLIGVLFFGLISGLKYGGAACIQHFTLRQILHKKGRIPWDYARFLDFASDRLLMKKVGGGYVFFHRMLLEHFAQRGEGRQER